MWDRTNKTNKKMMCVFILIKEHVTHVCVYGQQWSSRYVLTITNVNRSRFNKLL